MADERIDIYNEHNVRIGDMMKSEAYKQWQRMRAVHIWVINSDWKVLLQKRSEDKERRPWYRDISIGWHVGFGEDPTTSAIREAREELWISIENDSLQYITLHSTKEEDFTGHSYVYVMQYEWSFVFSDGEVTEIQWFSLDEVINILAGKNNQYPWVPHNEEFALVRNYLQENNLA